MVEPSASIATRPAPPRPGDDNVFIARHPIFATSRKVYGYELLFRSTTNNVYDGEDGVSASAQTIHRAVHVLGLHAVAGGHKIFVNFPERLVIEEMYCLLPPEQTVIELLETAPPTEELLDACVRMRKAGYQLALDDVCSAGNFGRIVELADYLKIDFMGVERAQLPDLVSRFRGTGAQLLAEKVESQEDCDQALALGFTYLQGFFFCKPELMRGRALAANRAVCLQLTRELARPEMDYRRVEHIIKSDVSLSFRMLRYLNSAAIGLRNKVTSIQQALALLGERNVRKWGTLVALTGLRGRKPHELLVVSLARARFCESLARAALQPSRELELFLIGLLSCIDALLDQPLPDVLAGLDFPPDARAVLLGQPAAPAELRRIYGLAIDCERGAWARIAEHTAALSLTQSEIAIIWYDSLTWADQVLLQAESA